MEDDRRDYSELIRIIGELKTDLKLEINTVVNEVKNIKENGVPLSKVRLGIKEACAIFASIIFCFVIPGVGGHYLNVGKNNEQDVKIESLEERQEVLYGREYDEQGTSNLDKGK